MDFPLRLPSSLPRLIEFSASRAQIGHRAQQTLGLPREAYGCAQFHHGLVEITRTLPTEQFFRGTPQILARKIFSVHPLQHALYVSVHDGDRLIKGNASNRRSGISANPR
jgi:hypothetical protein